MNEKEQFLKKVWPKVVEFFGQFGPANYTGYLGGKKQGWLGPYVWSEDGDVVRIITKFCEDEFGFLNVHNESPIDKFRYENFERCHEKREFIDVDVTDASDCKSEEDFRKLTHTLFIEVKHISKGSIYKDPEKKINGFCYDCAKLQHKIKEGRCKYAIAILIDDGDLKGESYVKNVNYFIEELKEKYPDVTPLIWQKKK